MDGLILRKVEFEKGSTALHAWIFQFEAVGTEVGASFTVRVKTNSNLNLAKSEEDARSRVYDLVGELNAAANQEVVIDD